MGKIDMRFNEGPNPWRRFSIASAIVFATFILSFPIVHYTKLGLSKIRLEASRKEILKPSNYSEIRTILERHQRENKLEVTEYNRFYYLLPELSVSGGSSTLLLFPEGYSYDIVCSTEQTCNVGKVTFSSDSL